MIYNFLKLEWKQYFRSSYWQKNIFLNVFLVFIALIVVLSFLSIGIGGYFIIKKEFPEVNPLVVVNSYLIFFIIGDLIFRYLMQKLPVLNVKPLMILPIKKKLVVHYLLGKSILSPFNFFSLFFYVPFAFVVYKEEEYGLKGMSAWLFTLICSTQIVNFLNFLINKNNKAFVVITSFLLLLIGLDQFSVVNVGTFSNEVFMFMINNPIASMIPLLTIIVLYTVNFNQLKTQIYLDEAITKEEKIAHTQSLSWTTVFGSVAPFIKNDIRLIWRNKRPKTVFLMSFLFLFYGLIFFTNETYKNMPAMLVFASLFVTGGFTINFGQFIPAWDSAHYKMLMSQSISYRKFLESKWFLMVIMTAILYVLSIPYLYFGTDIFLIITAGAIFNVGFNSLFLLFSGAYNKKRIDLEKSGFGNTQGTSVTQFIIIIPLMLLPMGLFWGFSSWLNFNAGIIAIAAVGILALIFKNPCMNWIEKLYISKKYSTINAFDKKD